MILHIPDTPQIKSLKRRKELLEGRINRLRSGRRFRIVIPAHVVLQKLEDERDTGTYLPSRLTVEASQLGDNFFVFELNGWRYLVASVDVESMEEL